MPRRWTAALAIAGVVAGAIALVIPLAVNGTDAWGWQMAARYTARVSFFLLLTVYMIAPLTRVVTDVPLLRVARRERRGLGLAFAGAHFVHLGALVTAIALSDKPPALLTVIFGGFGYVLIAAMALTSNDAAVRALGVNWRRLHTFGLHYVWFIFAVTYARRIASFPDMLEYKVLLGLAFAALAFRVAVWMNGRAPAQIKQ